MACGEAFRAWGEDNFGNLASKVKNLRKCFQELCKANTQGQNM